MKEVSFTFGNKSYKGYLAISTEEYPHYFWCFIDDPQLVKKVGDCITFQQEKGGQLKPTESFPKTHQDLITAIQTAIQQTIATIAAA